MLYLRLKRLKLVYIKQSAWDPFLNLDNEWNTLTWHDLSHSHSIECLVIRYTCQNLWSKMKVQIFSKSVSTLNCFPLSSGIRWGAHSQYFPIQPFTNSVTLCHTRVTSLNWLWMKSPIAPPAQCTVLDGAQFLSDLQFCKKMYIIEHILVALPTRRASARESPRTVSWRSYNHHNHNHHPAIMHAPS